MRIALAQTDIEQAIKAHLSAQGIVLKDKTFSAVFKAGRKGKGLSAQIEITDIDSQTFITKLTAEATVIAAPEVETTVEFPASEREVTEPPVQKASISLFA